MFWPPLVFLTSHLTPENCLKIELQYISFFCFLNLPETKIQKLGKSRLIINLICRSSNLESNFTGVTTSAKFEAAEGLERQNWMLVEVERPQERYMQHDSGRVDPRSRSNFQCDQISLFRRSALSHVCTPSKSGFSWFYTASGPLRTAHLSRECVKFPFKIW